jgi:dihydrodipicolinate synthase/N-acetylneuraminate lyase
VIAGTGAQSTRESKKVVHFRGSRNSCSLRLAQLCMDAKEAGASHVLVLTPSTWPPQMSVENIIRFHREVHTILSPSRCPLSPDSP